jgi:hypothetical protein
LVEQTRVREEQDPSVIAHQLAAQALREQETHRQKSRQKLDGAAKAKRDEAAGKIMLADGRLVTPMAAYMQSATHDFTVIPDDLIKRTKPYGKWDVRWVSKVDQFGNPSDTEVGYFQRFGYEFIYGAPSDANPEKPDPKKRFERKELIAMQGPPEGYAAHLARSSKPGSAVYDQAFSDLEDLADRTNKRAGKRIVDIVTSEEHGPERPEMVSL